MLLRQMLFPDIKDLPLSTRNDRDDLSSFIFLNYYSNFNKQAKDKFNNFSKKILNENPLAYPVTKNFTQSLTRKKQIIHSDFKVENSASLAHGHCAIILRNLQKGKLSLSRKKKIEKSIISLDQISIRVNECIFWPSYFLNEKEEYYQAISLSIHRGLGGVISILSLCHKLGIKKNLCMKLLTGVINQVLDIDKQTKRKGLPSFWGNSKLKKIKRNTCFYGDPGMGYVLTLAGIRCDNKTWIKNGKRIFIRGIQLSAKQAKITDLSFGMGASGLSHLAFRYCQMTKESVMLTHANRWLKLANKMHREGHQQKIKINLQNSKAYFPNSIHNSVLGYFMVQWVQTNLISSNWDSMYGLSNPTSDKII